MSDYACFGWRRNRAACRECDAREPCAKLRNFNRSQQSRDNVDASNHQSDKRVEVNNQPRHTAAPLFVRSEQTYVDLGLCAEWDDELCYRLDAENETRSMSATRFAVITLRLKGKTMQEIADHLGITQQRVNTIIDTKK